MLVLTVSLCPPLPVGVPAAVSCHLWGSPRSSGRWVKLLFSSRRSRERGEAPGHVGGAESGGGG